MINTIMKKSIFFLFLCLVSIPSLARAATEEYGFDKLHTQILFFVDHLGFADSEGEFLDFDGTIIFDRDQPDNSSVEVTISTASIEMDDEKWNEHLRSADFFNVEKFPDMTFKSTGISLTSENTADITGDLTLLGMTKPVTLHTTFNKAGPHPFNDKEYHAGFSATATIKRSEFGMKYGLPMVGDDVELRIEVEAIRKEDQATANP